MKKKIIHTLVYTYENHVSLEEHLICLKMIFLKWFLLALQILLR